MDHSKIVLLPEELSLLKRLVKHSPQVIDPADESAAASLCVKWHLISPESHGQYSVTKDGKRYLIHCKSHRRELWLKNLWIPIIVAFATTVLTNWLLPKLWLILQ